jgi:hypothetical protein
MNLVSESELIVPFLSGVYWGVDLHLFLKNQLETAIIMTTPTTTPTITPIVGLPL